MYILMVRIRVREEPRDDYLAAVVKDAAGSVLNEPGCRRFDVIQDREEPTSLALCEVYNDRAAFEDHLKQTHFKEFERVTEGWLADPEEVSKCRPVYPVGDASWDSVRPDAGRPSFNPDFFTGGLHIIHAPLRIKREHVDDFISAVTLDALGSVHNEPGCLRFDVYQNIEYPVELYLYEVYANRAAFESHATTPHIKKWAETVCYCDDGERSGGRHGRNIWPPDNWAWSSGRSPA